MRRRSRTRRILKWAGLGICVLLVSAFVVSLKWRICYVRPTWVAFLQMGAVAFDYWGHLPLADQEKYRSFWQPTGWDFFSERSFYWPGWFRLRFSSGAPLWMLFVVFAVPTAFLWWRDRPPPPGHCQSCGYNLTGNTSGRCPECGAPL